MNVKYIYTQVCTKNITYATQAQLCLLLFSRSFAKDPITSKPTSIKPR